MEKSNKKLYDLLSSGITGFVGGSFLAFIYIVSKYFHISKVGHKEVFKFFLYQEHG